MKCAILAVCESFQDSGDELVRAHLRVKPDWHIALHLGENIPEVGVLTIPCSAQQIAQLSARRRGRLWRKCEKALERAGVDCLYAVDDLIGLEGGELLWGNFEMPDGHALMRDMAYNILCQVAKQRGLDLMSAEVGVWQSSFDETGYTVLHSIADSLKYLTLFTGEPASAAPYVERLFLQTGLSANIAQQTCTMARCDVILMLDEYSGPPAGDRTVFLDFSHSWRSGCLNTACFSLPPILSALGPFFGHTDQRAMDFLLHAYEKLLIGETNLSRQIQAIGCRLQQVCYKPPKILDKVR